MTTLDHYRHERSEARSLYPCVGPVMRWAILAFDDQTFALQSLATEYRAPLRRRVATATMMLDATLRLDKTRKLATALLLLAPELITGGTSC